MDERRRAIADARQMNGPRHIGAGGIQTRPHGVRQVVLHVSRTTPAEPLRLPMDRLASGRRSSFRDWAAERTNHPREVIEAALVHVVANQTEAYARSDLLERRRRLMDDWSAYLSGAHGQVWHDDGNRASRPGCCQPCNPHPATICSGGQLSAAAANTACQ